MIKYIQSDHKTIQLNLLIIKLLYASRQMLLCLNLNRRLM